MNKIFSLIIILLFITNPVFAKLPNTTSKSNNNPPGKITALKLGEPAPWDGILFSMEAAAWVSAQNKYLEKRIKLERENATEIANEECNLKVKNLNTKFLTDQKIYEANISSLKLKLNSLQKITAHNNNSSKFFDIALWIGGGFLIGILSTTALFLSIK
jgi:hypothetical protein